MGNKTLALPVRAEQVRLNPQRRDIIDADGNHWAVEVPVDRAALIVTAVNSHEKFVEIVQRWLICCDLAGVDAERDGAIPDNQSLNPYIQLLRDSRALLTSCKREGEK